MKKLIYLLLLAVFSTGCSAQSNLFNAGLCHTGAPPAFNPGAKGCRLALDTASQTFYVWKIGTTWAALGRGVDEITGCSAPLYTPTKWQSYVAINKCDPPEMYYYFSGAWHLSGGAGNTDISFVDNGGNDVDITSSTGTGYKMKGYNGIQIYQDDVDVIAIDGATANLWTDGGATTFLTATGDKLAVGSSTAKAKINAIGSGSTAASYSFMAETASRLPQISVRNDGQIGIGRDLTITTDSAITICSIRSSADFSRTDVRYTNNTVANKYYPVSFLGGEIFYKGSQAFLRARGIDFNVYNDNTNTGNDVTAGFFSARNSATTARSSLLTAIDCSSYTDNQNGGTVSDITGIRVRYIGINAAGPTATTVNGLKIQDLLNSGTITNTYGIYVGDISTGTQTNRPYSFYASDPDARSYFAGRIELDKTNTAGGTTGNQTINKPSGTVNFAAGATALTVTNNLVSTSSTVLAVLRTDDATATLKNVVPAAGSFTINLTAATTAETSVGFMVINY